MATVETKVRLAAVADLHYTRSCAGSLAQFFARVGEHADVLLLCGDLTDHGLPEEARTLAHDLASLRDVPIVAVLGNHDFESGKPKEVQQILMDAGVHLLDGDGCEVLGVGFAGAKGFGGGFTPHILEPWGEHGIKNFVHEAVEEALKLESALARLRTTQRIALLHYSPIRATVEGEPPEIFTLMGCSRLEEPLNRFSVACAFHGHAHHGSPEGETSTGIPVYNVSIKLLERMNPHVAPFRSVVIPMG
jgi:Icc-related predicted phosphoesterase